MSSGVQLSAAQEGVLMLLKPPGTRLESRITEGGKAKWDVVRADGRRGEVSAGAAAALRHLGLIVPSGALADGGCMYRLPE